MSLNLLSRNAATWKLPDAEVEPYINARSAREKGEAGWLPLHLAAMYKASPALLSKLLEEYPEGARTKNDYGWLPLHYAADNNASPALLSKLLEEYPEGARAKNDDGCLPSDCSNSEEVKALLKAWEANPEAELKKMKAAEKPREAEKAREAQAKMPATALTPPPPPPGPAALPVAAPTPQMHAMALNASSAASAASFSKETAREQKMQSITAFLASACDLQEEVAEYAEALVNDGFDKVKDLAQIEADEWPEIIKKGHRKRILLAAKEASTSAAAPPPSPSTEDDKFIAVDLVLGEAEDAASGITRALGLTDGELGAKMQLGEQAIVDEFTRHGSEEDKGNLDYVLRGVARQEPYPKHIRVQLETGKYHGGSLSFDDFDTGHQGMRLEDFVNHEQSKIAQLTRTHVLALRLYTSSSFRCFNNALRKREKPHPFAMSVYWLSEAIKLLRGVAAKLQKDEKMKEVVLWRGMANMKLDKEKLKEQGGTEFALMSTSRSKSVAFKYAASRCPLVFKYVTHNFMVRGVSLAFLSMYPKEVEYLYPPYTFIQPVNIYQEQGIDIVEVMPTMP